MELFQDPLGGLARRHGTDKCGGHFYTPHYHRHFSALRDSPIVLLEIGIGGYESPLAGGESLRMWKDYFPKGKIIGLDVFDKSPLEEERIIIEMGSQRDPRVLRRLGELHGPFDVIIDDGSHRVRDVLASFNGLWKYLRDGGWYVIEDLQTSYWRPFGGSSAPLIRKTTIAFLKGLIDSLNYAETDRRNYVPSQLDLSVVRIEFAHNIVFVEKGRNDEPSNIMPPHPHPRQFTRSALLLGLPRRGLRLVRRRIRQVAGRPGSRG